MLNAVETWGTLLLKTHLRKTNVARFSILTSRHSREQTQSPCDHPESGDVDLATPPIDTDRDGTPDYRDLDSDNDGLPDGATVDDERVFDQVQYGARRIDQEEKVRSFGPFLSLEKDLGTALTLTLAGRYDRYRFEVTDRFTTDGRASGGRDMDQFSPMAGLVYRPSPLTRLYGHIATAFQTPTTSELGNQPTGEGGFNPDLEPERITALTELLNTL